MSATVRSLTLLPVLALLFQVTSCNEFIAQNIASSAAAKGSRKSLVKEDFIAGDSDTFPINLETTLQLAASRNPELANAVERARLAAARSDLATLSLLPDLAAGASFARQNGLLQEIGGDPILTERVSNSRGLGTSSGVPGIGLDLSLSEAIFEPLAAKQDSRAAAAIAVAEEHRLIAASASAYFELVRATASLQLAREIEGAAGNLARSTRSFAEAGEGLAADSERAAATHLLRRGETARAEADLVIRSSELARLLHLPASLTLVPVDRSVAATHLVDTDEPAARLVATALRFRPEAEAMQAGVSAAASRLVGEKIRPFLPNVAASYSSYDFAAGRGAGTDGDDSRDEVAAMIYWKLEGLGFGNAAETREKSARFELARLEEERTLDLITHEVTSLQATVIAHRKRLSIGSEAAAHARKSYQLTTARLEQSQGLPIEALASIQTLAEARQAEIDAVLDYNIAQHRLLAALGHPGLK